MGSSDPQDLTSEKVTAISNQLSRIAVYSAVMDQATGAVLLGPIAEKLTALLKDISSDTTYTNADLEKYRALLQFANELHPLLTDYYVPMIACVHEIIHAGFQRMITDCQNIFVQVSYQISKQLMV